MANLGLTARLDLDGRGFQRTLDSSERKLTAFGANLKSRLAAYFSVSALSGFATQMARNIAAIQDFADQLGISTADIQRLQFAAATTGLEFGALSAGIGRFQAAMANAAEGNEKALRAFQLLGIEAPKTQAQMVAAMQAIGRSLGENLSPEKTDALRELFGRSGFRMAAALREIAANTPIQITTDEDIRRFDKLLDNMEVLKLRAQGLFGRLFGGVAEDLAQHPFRTGALGAGGIIARVVQDQITDLIEGKVKQPFGTNILKGFKEEPGFIGPPLPPGFKFSEEKAKKEKAIKESFEPFTGFALNQLQQIGGLYNNPATNRMLQVNEKIERHLAVIERAVTSPRNTGATLFGET